jgi:hypothetical protein
MSSNDTLIEIRDLLGEIRDLLLPVADAHQDEYDRRQDERHAARVEAIKSAISTPKRKKAWGLADGSRNQTALARDAGMDQAGASRFLKSLRDLGAIADEGNPKRLIEVDA